jgi:hypothetical protein
VGDCEIVKCIERKNMLMPLCKMAKNYEGDILKFAYFNCTSLTVFKTKKFLYINFRLRYLSFVLTLHYIYRTILKNTNIQAKDMSLEIRLIV